MRVEHETHWIIKGATCSIVSLPVIAVGFAVLVDMSSSLQVFASWLFWSNLWASIGLIIIGLIKQTSKAVSVLIYLVVELMFIIPLVLASGVNYRG